MCHLMRYAVGFWHSINCCCSSTLYHLTTDQRCTSGAADLPYGGAFWGEQFLAFQNWLGGNF